MQVNYTKIATAIHNKECSLLDAIALIAKTHIEQIKQDESDLPAEEEI